MEGYVVTIAPDEDDTADTLIGKEMNVAVSPLHYKTKFEQYNVHLYIKTTVLQNCKLLQKLFLL